MKFSEDSPEHREANIAYIKERWNQLSGLELEWGTEGIKYLLFVNSGAAVAVLAFHGSVAEVRTMVWPKVMLGFFVLGVVIIGLLHIVRHLRVALLFREWRKAVADYYGDDKGWREIVSEDNTRAEKFPWAVLLAYFSFSCFVVGVAIGMLNFSALTSGESNARKEAGNTSANSDAVSKTIDTTTMAVQGIEGLRQGNQSITKHPTTSP